MLKVNNLSLINTYAYKVLSVSDKYITSPLVEIETLLDGRKQQYQYDSYGNVARKTLRSKENIILEDEVYSYDESFRLTNVQNLSYLNGVLKDTLVYEYGYDINGNISYINKYLNGNVVDELYTSYQNVFKDRLHNLDGAWTGDKISITYPTTDKFKPNKITKNGVAKTLQWDGNNLTRYGDYVYTYNSLGLRTSKEVGEVLTIYKYEGSKLIGLTRTENDDVINMEFNYDQNNILIGFTIENNEYFYIRDILGNILGIIDQEGNVVVYYKYDVYGNLILKDVKIDNLASRYNPFIYKGYYYDVETGLFWLSSRYYSPELCRFISPDDVGYLDPSSINGLNLYSYCMNDPINYADPSGHWVETVFDLFSLGVSIVEVIINPYDPLNWAGLAGDALDLIPFVTGVGETVRGVKVVAKGVDMADDVYDTIKIMKVADLTDDAWDTVRGLDRAGDFTQSTMSAGRRIHKGYKTFDIDGKEFRRFRGIRLDYFDEAGRLVYELKPYNINSLKAGVSQLARYRRKMGKGYTWILELY